jgi:lactate permease
MNLLPVILTVIPFIIFVYLLLFKKTPLVWVSLITLVLINALAIVYWNMYPAYLFGSFAKGILVAFDIFLIIFGAIFFLEIMQKTRVIENIGYYLESFSKDLRIQVIFLAWFFGSFLEGTAGFGTPSTIIAPLLMGLGIGTINAVIIVLLANSAPVTFGAAGAPIKIGFGELAGASVPLKAAILNCIGILVPVFILWFLTRGKEDGKKQFFEALPFAIWAGVAFSVPSIFTVYIGQEFPSILGSVIGLILVLITTKLGIFIPKSAKQISSVPHLKSLSLSKVILPYFLLITLLIAGKFAIGAKGVVLPLVIKHTFSYYNPGFAFIIAGIAAIWFFKLNKAFFRDTVKSAAQRSWEPFLVIAFMAIVSQIMVSSVNNYSNLPSMIDFLAASARNSLLPLWAPMVGTFGSFLTGSATVSNLMFGNFLAEAARELGMNVDNILALAVVGGAAGNMIALGDVMVAETVVGLKNEERKVIKGVIIPCLIYVALVGIAGLLMN